MPPWRDGDRAKLETLCACTEVEAFGVQKYPEFHVKVAKFFYSAAKLHAFPNGNKRFALTATIFFLIRNGFRLDEEVVGEAPGIARLVAAADPHQPWGKPDIVISLIADAFFKTSIVPLDGASS